MKNHPENSRNTISRDPLTQHRSAVRWEGGSGGPFAAMRLFLILSLLFALTACGFHLRGSGGLPQVMRATYIEGESGSLAGEAGVILAAHGAQRVTQIEQATAVLNLESERLERRILSIDTAGQVAEYELSYALAFSLNRASGEILLPSRVVHARRVLSANPDRLLSQENEEGLLYKEMRRAALEQLMARIRADLRRD